MGKPNKLLRNFCIIAHIDHGKSTLADRLIERTGQVSKRDMEEQLLDSMDIERERGITIKLTPVRMYYTAKDGKEYEFNLIDTPGHVDFTYEVSRSLAACEGAILVVDATQGVEAQTLANVYLALENDLEILPVINKIDLPSARVDEVKKEIEDVIGLPADGIPCVSAKEGTNIEDLLEAITQYFPSPDGETDAPLKALIFDSYYDNYKGVILFVRIMDGEVKVGDKIKPFLSSATYDVTEVGAFAPGLFPKEVLKAGEVGYIAASIKSIQDVAVGDTVTLANNPAKEPLPGYKKVQPVVFCGIYPLDGSKFNDLKEAILKLQLNDAALIFEPDNSVAVSLDFCIWKSFKSVSSASSIWTSSPPRRALATLSIKRTVKSCTWTIPRICPIRRISNIWKSLSSKPRCTRPPIIWGPSWIYARKNAVYSRI